jgi:hypothetical protein
MRRICDSRSPLRCASWKSSDYEPTDFAFALNSRMRQGIASDDEHRWAPARLIQGPRC